MKQAITKIFWREQATENTLVYEKKLYKKKNKGAVSIVAEKKSRNLLYISLNLMKNVVLDIYCRI